MNDTGNESQTKRKTKGEELRNQQIKEKKKKKKKKKKNGNLLHQQKDDMDGVAIHIPKLQEI